MLDKALEAKGYLPTPRVIAMAGPWQQSLVSSGARRLRRFRKGTICLPQNRLTLIRGRLTITSGGTQVWQTTPPSPQQTCPCRSCRRTWRAGWPQSERSDEFERLLYKNARDQIDEKFGWPSATCRLALRCKPPEKRLNARPMRPSNTQGCMSASSHRIACHRQTVFGLGWHR